MSHEDLSLRQSDLGGDPGVIRVPVPSLVVLIGASASGKSTFARRHFHPTEVISSDVCRGLVCDDELDQGATQDAFDLLHFLLHKRLRRARLTIVDATSVRQEDRARLVQAGQAHGVPVVAIVFDLPTGLSLERNSQRQARGVPEGVIRSQRQALRVGLPTLNQEGFHRIWLLETEAQVARTSIQRDPAPTESSRS